MSMFIDGSTNVAPPVAQILDTGSLTMTRIHGVLDEDLPVIGQLVSVWRDKYARNLLRSAYYSCKERLKDFGISIPEQMRGGVAAMIGWPELAVRSLSDLSDFQGFSVDEDDAYGVQALFDDNELDVVASQLIVSAYKHGCSFLTVGADPMDASRILLTPRSADWSAGVWDTSRNRLKAALTITTADTQGRITGFTVWLADRVYDCSYAGGKWSAVRFDTNLGEPSVVAFAYDRQVDTPFGHSRITRSLMSLTDIAFRSMVRMEATSEFYSAPKLWFLGLDRNALGKDTWRSLIQAINSVSSDQNGDLPQIHQVQQASMQPHSDMLKTLAMLCSSITRLPVDYLGITMDNPSSAEAMAAAERRLTRIADRQNVMFGRSLWKALSMAIRLRDHVSAAPEGLRGIQPVWAATREVSDAARADAFTKIAGQLDGYATSSVGLHRLGLSNAEIFSLKADLRRDRANKILDQIRVKTSTPLPRSGQDETQDTTPDTTANMMPDATNTNGKDTSMTSRVKPQQSNASGGDSSRAEKQV